MPSRSPPIQSVLAVLLVLPVFILASCNDPDDDVVVVGLAGTSASDFRSLADYLADPAVQTIFRFMPRNSGSTPPGVEGRYLANGVVVASSVPGAEPGDAVDTEFCFGPPAGAAIEVAVIDPTAVDAGAFSFIEGSGDLFTVFTAFKSVQTGPNGGTCEVHQVVVFSGEREADGSLSALFIGLGIVGLLGDCGSLLVDDIQVSENSTGIPTPSCVGGGTPADPARVLVEVDNFLVVDADVFVDGVLVGTAPLLSSFTFEALPGFTLSFDIVPPLNENGDFMGELLAGTFPADTQPAGRFSQYSISNQIGDETFFAPLVLNQTAGPLTVRVNVGTLVPFNCDCSLAPSPLAQYTVGYHFYDSLNVPIFPADTNVLIDDEVPAAAPTEFPFAGPFNLAPDSGTVSFLIP